MARVLVTDGEQRSALAVVRSLGRANHEVLVCSQRPRSLAGASRHCSEAFQVPDPSTRFEEHVAAVERIVHERAVDVLVPLTDSASAIVPDLCTRCPKVAVAFPQYASYEALSDKRHLVEAAAALGVPVPRQSVAETRAGRTVALEEARSAGIEVPLVLKPARSVVRRGASLARTGVTIAQSWADAERALASHPEEFYPVLVQERIVGPGLGVSLLFHEGAAIAAFAHRRLREKPPTGGVAVYRESIPLGEDLRAHAVHILEHFCWSGVAMVEFKEDAATGTPYLMEVNGRFWGSLQLAIDAGIDFPALLLEATVGGQPPAHVPPYTLGIRSRWLWGDVDHLLWMLRTPASKRAGYGLPGRLGALARFLVLWRPGDRYEVLQLRDPKPFVIESIEWLRAVRG